MKSSELKQGDTIGIIAPSSGLSALYPHRLKQSIRFLKKQGFEVKAYPTTTKLYKGKAGTIEERLADFHDAFTSSEIKGILCAIGGISSNDLIRHIDYEVVKKNPKVFCGYSDVSVLHYALLSQAGLTTFYGPAAMTQFGEHPAPLQYTLEYFLKAVSGKDPIGRIEPAVKWTDEVLDWSEKKDLERPRRMELNEGYLWINEGRASGKIVGGCLPSILQLKGTEFDVDYAGKILFLETPEGSDFRKGPSLIQVDSQLRDLQNARVLEKIEGLIVGRPFGFLKEERQEFYSILSDHVRDYEVPVVANVDLGHTDPIITIPLGVDARLDSNYNLFSIEESGIHRERQ